MFSYDDEYDLPPRLVNDTEEDNSSDVSKLDLCPKNTTVESDGFGGTSRVFQGPHYWDQRYRDNRPNSENDDYYTIYQCAYCRRYNSRWESRQLNAPPANTH
jgi:hypothetical protein